MHLLQKYPADVRSIAELKGKQISADSLTSHIKAYRESLNWLDDPKNKESAIQLFIKKVPTATLQSAEVSYGPLLDPKTALNAARVL